MGDISFGIQRISTVLILLLSVNPAFTGYSRSSASQTGKDYRENSIPKGNPVFDNTITSDITVTIGQTAYLPCVVHDLGDKVVSWIRTRDLHILTSGPFTFTADPRIDIVVDHNAESWTLKIDQFKMTDSGKYECQVNTDPKIKKVFSISMKEKLLQDSPLSSWLDSGAVRASIAGPEEQYIKIGSTVTFDCILDYGIDKKSYERTQNRFATRSIPNVQWLKDGLALSFQAERGGISVETERGEKTGSSRLTLASVGSGDSGRYTCTGLGITPSSVTLNVIEGEYMDAMQRDDYNAVASTSSTNPLQPHSLLILGCNLSSILVYIFSTFIKRMYIR